jgi:hypothetical protein
MSTSTPLRLGATGLRGWRAKVGDAVAGPADRHTPLSEDHARAIVGAVFLALSAVYLAMAARDVVRTLRDG